MRKLTQVLLLLTLISMQVIGAESTVCADISETLSKEISNNKKVIEYTNLYIQVEKMQLSALKSIYNSKSKKIDDKVRAQAKAASAKLMSLIK